MRSLGEGSCIKLEYTKSSKQAFVYSHRECSCGIVAIILYRCVTPKLGSFHGVNNMRLEKSFVELPPSEFAHSSESLFAFILRA